jgi:hypothetical protein
MEIPMMRRALGVLLTAALLAGSGARALAAGLITLIPNGAVDVRLGEAASWRPVTEQETVSAGEAVRTHRESTAELHFSDGSRVQIGSFSIFSIDKTDTQETGFSLKLGKIRAAFAGLLSSHVSIRTPTAVCAVRGTVFDVGADEKGTEVTMAEGVLEVTDKQGKQAVITSEETMHIGENGLERPHMLSLNDKRSLPAVRPYAVRQERARDSARKAIEDNRNRELKVAQAQLGQDVVDAYGVRVRLEEYLIRPNVDSFEVLFLSSRQGSFNWGHLVETFNAPLPTDLSQVPAIVAGGIMSPSATAPANWLKSYDFYATNTIDADDEKITFGAPTQINFAGFNNGITNLLWYPSSIDYTQTLSGPGVPGGSRIQFEQQMDYGATFTGLITWAQSVQVTPGATGLPVPILVTTLDPTSVASVNNLQNGGTIVYGGPTWVAGTGPNLYNEVANNTSTTYPNGTNKADILETTLYPDGSSVSVQKFLVSDSGQLLDFGSASDSLFTQNNDYNLELTIGSNLFQGRSIDVLIAPQILNQKAQETPGPVGFQP